MTIGMFLGALMILYISFLIAKYEFKIQKLQIDKKTYFILKITIKNVTNIPYILKQNADMLSPDSFSKSF